jgi:hypothetical protein
MLISPTLTEEVGEMPQYFPDKLKSYLVRVGGLCIMS